MSKLKHNHVIQSFLKATLVIIEHPIFLQIEESLILRTKITKYKVFLFWIQGGIKITYSFLKVEYKGECCSTPKMSKVR